MFADVSIIKIRSRRAGMRFLVNDVYKHSHCVQVCESSVGGAHSVILIAMAPRPGEHCENCLKLAGELRRCAACKLVRYCVCILSILSVIDSLSAP